MTEKPPTERIAQALLLTDSPDYSRRAGATLDELSLFAREGDLHSFSLLVKTYCALVPLDERKVRAAMPAKIKNQIFYLGKELPKMAIDRWEEMHPDWKLALDAALFDGDRLAFWVEQAAAAIRRAEVG
ncbi:MAG: hypothetical protein AB7E24_23295 [Novosphingobium sp.]